MAAGLPTGTVDTLLNSPDIETNFFQCPRRRRRVQEEEQKEQEQTPAEERLIAH